MTSFTIDANAIGMMLDLILNGPDETGPNAFVLVIVPEVENTASTMRAHVTANVPPRLASEILKAAAVQSIKEEN